MNPRARTSVTSSSSTSQPWKKSPNPQSRQTSPTRFLPFQTPSPYGVKQQRSLDWTGYIGSLRPSKPRLARNELAMHVTCFRTARSEFVASTRPATTARRSGHQTPQNKPSQLGAAFTLLGNHGLTLSRDFPAAPRRRPPRCRSRPPSMPAGLARRAASPAAASPMFLRTSRPRRNLQPWRCVPPAMRELWIAGRLLSLREGPELRAARCARRSSTAAAVQHKKWHEGGTKNKAGTGPASKTRTRRCCY